MDDTSPGLNKFEQKVALWTAYYRCNIHRFAEDYLMVKLKLFQKILLFMMNLSTTNVIITCRGLGKTFLTALFCCIRCILYPGTSICVCSKTRKQGNELVKKIKEILMPNSPMLRMEIEEISVNQYDTTVSFKNASKIFVVCANDNARGVRCNVLIIDEYRMVNPKIYSTVLKKFLNVNRQPGYLSKPEYRGQTAEENIECFLSSAFYCDNWAYDTFRNAAAHMITGTRPSWCCALPYNLAVKEGLLSTERVQSEKTSSEYSEIVWRMEMEALFYNGAESSLYSYEDTENARQIEFAFYPPELSNLITDKRIRIPQKMHNEVRILSADIALMASTKDRDNDATSIHINQLLLNGNGGINKIVYTCNNEGCTTSDEALIIRRLFNQFDCDYLVIDARGVGLGVLDRLLGDIYDPATGVVYGGLSCYNNTEIAARCHIPNAPKVIYAVTATADFNSRIALGLREAFRQGKVQILKHEDDFEEFANEHLAGYAKLSIEDKTRLKMPYINTTLLNNELVSLEYETKNGIVRVHERANMRKDRYSSLAYNIEISKQIEREYYDNQNKNNFSAYMIQFRQPNTRKR